MARASREVRRAQIVEGLAVVLRERSYAEASVQLIAREAGVTPGLVHYHFSSKREVLLALVERITAAWRERVAEGQAEARGHLGRVRALVDGTLALGDAARPAEVFLWTALGGEAMRNEDVAEAFRTVLREEMVALERDLEALGIRQPARAARAVAASIEGVFRLASVGLVPAGEGAAIVHRVVDALVLER